MVVMDLVAFGSFQHKAFAAGYIYLPSPRSVCMRGCHSSPSPAPSRPLDVPFEFLRPTPGPLSPDDLGRIQEWLSRQSPQPAPAPGPRPTPAPQPAPAPRREPDAQRNCRQQHPYAPPCSGIFDIEEVAVDFLMRNGYSYSALGDCYGKSSFAPGVIDACEGAPGESWHCRVNGIANEISIFGCLCCDEDGTTALEWRGAHWSVNLSGRRP
jgi:hypothetical protein